MSTSFAPTHAQGRRLAGALLATLLLAAPAFARQDHATAEQAQTRQKLAALQSRMKALAAQQAATASRRDRLDAALAKQAEALAVAARAVRQTDAKIAATQQQLDQLQQQRSDLQQQLGNQRDAIAELLRASYALGKGSDLRLLLGGDDMTRVARALAYSKYFQQDRVQKVQQLMGELAQLQTLEASIDTQQQALQAELAQRQQQMAVLRRQRAAQQRLADQVDAQYRTQAQRLAAMQQNERSLDQVLARLQAAIDAAARATAQNTRKRSGRGNGIDERLAPPAGHVADIRGNLPWPASGPVHDFGNGVLIAAPAGSDVHAVAAGRVVYAHFLRGYGLLVIVNDGNGWMSMYGNNETLLRGVGDDVRAGTVLGTAMPSTSSSTGVYFELRHDGNPVDPRSWLRRQR